MPNITLKNTLLHFKKICVHKFWVAHYCFKAGLYWRGITHDLSKFSWIEFWESVRYYQGTSSPINAAKADQGYSLAWQHHKGRNTHHYEYWTDKYDDGTVALQMPFTDTVEMLCDYLGAARAYMGKKFSYEKEAGWWHNKIYFNNIKMHKVQQLFLSKIFNELSMYEQENGKWKWENAVLSMEHLKYAYEESKKENYRMNIMKWVR